MLNHKKQHKITMKGGVHMKQMEFQFWNKVIDRKLLEAKEQKLERRNQWIRKNLYPTQSRTNEIEEANINGLLK